MNEIVIRSGVSRIVRKVLGVIAILAGTAWLLANIGELKFFDILYFVVFVVLGVSHLTNSFGQEITRLGHNDVELQIKWFNRFRTRIIRHTEIEKILLKRFEIVVVLKSGRKLNYSLDNFETGQKKDVYQYFIDYTISNGIEAVRAFEK